MKRSNFGWFKSSSVIGNSTNLFHLLIKPEFDAIFNQHESAQFKNENALKNLLESCGLILLPTVGEQNIKIAFHCRFDVCGRTSMTDDTADKTGKHENENPCPKIAMTLCLIFRHLKNTWPSKENFFVAKNNNLLKLIHHRNDDVNAFAIWQPIFCERAVKFWTAQRHTSAMMQFLTNENFKLQPIACRDSVGEAADIEYLNSSSTRTDAQPLCREIYSIKFIWFVISVCFFRFNLCLLAINLYWIEFGRTYLSVLFVNVNKIRVT